ncbi:MAG: tetratricopeptide repeat protein [Verrucomicrobiota bacterium]
MRRYAREFFIMLLLFLGTALVFWPVVRADFVDWDDPVLISQNPHLRGLNAESLHWMFTDVAYVFRYQPLSWLTWFTVYEFGELNPRGYHLANLIVHGLNAALLFLLLRKLLLLGVRPAGSENTLLTCAALGALLWAVHPLRVEAVAWVSAYLHCQALFFVLLAALFYLAAQTTSERSRKWACFAASVGSYGASLLSYPTGIGFPAVLVVLDLFPLQRWSFARADRWRVAARIVLEKAAFFLPAVAILAFTLYRRQSGAEGWPTPVSLESFGVLERTMQGFYIWAYYLWKPFAPVDLSPYYVQLVEFNPMAAPFVVSALLVLGLGALLGARCKHWPALAAAFACHLVLLVPVLGLTEHPHFPSDRYCYLGGIPLAVAATAALFWLARVHAEKFRFVVLATAVIAVALGVASNQQTRVWNNSVTLFEHMLTKLGESRFRADVYRRLGKHYHAQGDIPKALENYQRAVEVEPSYAEAQHLYGLALAEQGRHAEAATHFYAALANNPRHAAALSSLALSLAELRQFEDAIRIGEQARQLRPRDARTLNNLGLALFGAGRIDEARAQFEAAVRAEPNYALARLNLAKTFLAVGNFKDAVRELRETLRLQPDSTSAALMLARILATHPDATLRNGAEAVRLVEAVRAKGSPSASLLDTLATAYAEAGRFAEAVSTAREALTLARAQGQTRLAADIEKRLKLFEAGQPFRVSP